MLLCTFSLIIIHFCVWLMFIIVKYYFSCHFFSVITCPISVVSNKMISVKQTDTKEISGIDGVNMKHPFAEVSLDDKLPRGALMCRHPH